jgi:uncharacterized protein
MLRRVIAAAEATLVFFPYKGEDASPASFGISFTTVGIDTPDGERLVAWQLEPDDAIADIVYFHGNGGNLSVWLPVLAALHRQRYRVLAVDYRGYGLSTGSPSERGVYLDAAATVRHAARTRRADRPFVFWGRSLGGAIAASATHTEAPDGLVLESTFPNKAAVIRNQPLLRVLNVFASYRFDTVELLRGFTRPVLVIHGDRDRIIGVSLGRELFDSLPGPKKLVVVRGADHNDSFEDSHPEYWRPIRDFIDRLQP